MFQRNWIPKSWKRVLAVATLAGIGGMASANGTEETTTILEPEAQGIVEGSTVLSDGSDCCCAMDCCNDKSGFLRSDHCFDDFSHPVSQPVFSKDPRSNTHVRFLFINNWTPKGNAAIPDTSLQVYAAQVNIALTERLCFIADKDGYAVINDGPLGEGILNLGAGLKYTLIRDVENQFLVTPGFMFEVPTGESQVLQGDGDGVLTPFVIIGKGFGRIHSITNLAYSIPMDGNDNSEFFYASQHLDYALTDWFRPLMEVNWFSYSSGGDVLPAAVGEGDGLINIGTAGMAGQNLVTMAFGARAYLTDWASTGIAYEFPVSDRKDLIDGRLNVDFIIRY